jgi:hypothetical protein
MREAGGIADQYLIFETLLSSALRRPNSENVRESVRWRPRLWPVGAAISNRSALLRGWRAGRRTYVSQ